MTVRTSCHAFRATDGAADPESGGTLEIARAMASHENPRTTTLYDRTGDEITRAAVERIVI
jgi:integrase/recombinase XerD